MARYTYKAEELLWLRQSPLCVKPSNLPPEEEWMGPPVDQTRTQTKTTNDRFKVSEGSIKMSDSSLLDQTNRRPGVDRHVSRNSANPEDLVFAPPRMAFASTRANKPFEDRAMKDAETQGRFSLRSRNNDADGDRHRDGRNDQFRRRGEGDQDNEGWSTVKPRKSFGHEGAERFQGRMGGNFRDDKRAPRDDRDPARDRPSRGFDGPTRDKEVLDADSRLRNGPGRTKPEMWARGDGPEAPAPEKRERGDKTRSWRERAPESNTMDDRSNNRNNERRWGRDRDQRGERDPEWMDEPADAPREAHTQQDFQKWMEQMKKAKDGSSGAASGAQALEPEIEEKRVPLHSAPAVETGPDKFFQAFGSGGALGATTPGEQKEAPAKLPKAGGKSSRFTSFFATAQDDTRSRTEVSTPPTGPPAPTPGASLAAALAGMSAPSAGPEDERQAFASLLAKLQKQSMSTTPSGPSPFAAPPQQMARGAPDGQKRSAVTSPENFTPFGGERRDGPVGRPPSQQYQEILSPRPQPQSARPDQLLQDVLASHQRTASQGSGRMGIDSAQNNSNTEFLMGLMRRAPEPQRSEKGQPQQPPPQQQQPFPPHLQQHMMRMPPQPQGQKQGQMPPMNDHEPEFGRDSRGPQQRQMRPPPPPGFQSMDDIHGLDHDGRGSQPTQILQRPPPPPGLGDMPPGWMPPPQQRGPMIPPPGLVGGAPPNLGRNGPMPPHMFPPNFPPGGMPPPPPEAMGGMPPRNMPLPPPGFFNGPPPGFIPPGMPGFGGPPGPEPHGFPGSPFDARGMPPPGNAGRGLNYGRP